MSIFDPLGFFTPFTIQSRMLMQEVWSSKIDWDTELKDREFRKWQEWLRELETVKECRIQRCYQLRDFQIKTAELHIFCDASSRAYASVAYWRFNLYNGTFHVSLVFAKARVAPLKPTTIPRLELQAALLGTRIAKVIGEEHEFKISRRVFWSDSVTVLRWIRKEPNVFKTFVANRLGKISDNSKEQEWRWVPTTENPADDGTRLASGALKEGSRWLLGPSFLRSVESQWPKENFVNFDENSEAEEIKSVQICTVNSRSPLIDFTRFSSLNRAITVVYLVCLAVAKMRKNAYSYTELRRRAELICIKESQYLSFPQEITDLKRNNCVAKGSHLLKLNPFLNEQAILCAEGRVAKFSEKSSSITPIILGKKEKFTKLLVRHYHEKYYHGSHETVNNEIKQKYWVIALRQVLRGIVSKCTVCRFLRGKPFNPKMAALPFARLAYKVHPFSHCGLDYFGPLTVKIGRRHEKRWGALFTCMTTRAIHLEIANTLSTDSVIMALKRFISRRRRPLCIYSDNGTNFKGAAKELKEALKELGKHTLKEYAAKNDIDWRFNPPTASHMGGAWERLIRTVKTALTVVLRGQTPKEEVLATVFAEVEHAVNSRPLTHVSVDPRDQEALTPNHFLIGASSNEIRFGSNDQNLCTRRGWRTSQSLTDEFWRRWLREYLPTLIPQNKWHKSDDPIRIGDVVLILDQNIERNQWRKGLVLRIFIADDKEVRVAEVKTQHGILIRPTRKLVRFVDVQN